MKVFADSSVLLAASGSLSGASSEVFRLLHRNPWQLVTIPYVLGEVEKNLLKVASNLAVARWQRLKPLLEIRANVLTLDWIYVFEPAKDRPVLFSALAHAEVLLTLDRADFQSKLGSRFFSLDILKPGDFLERERVAGRLVE